jgi:transmembrane E3 ubiquitin-protein ligase
VGSHVTPIAETTFKGRIELTDPNAGEDLSLFYEAVHFVNNGSIYGLVDSTGCVHAISLLYLPTISPRKHPDIRLIPSLVPPAHTNATARAIEVELASRIARIKSLIDSGNLDGESSDSGVSISNFYHTYTR